MTVEPSQTAHDLRGDAVGYRRYRDHAAKWALGERHANECPDDACPSDHCLGIAAGTKRPRQPRGPRSSAANRRELSRLLNKGSRLANKATRYDVLEVQASIGSEDDTSDESTGFPGDDEITYSFDAPCGPRHGSQILELALTQAVENFEGKQTDKLIREEYEVVRPELELASARSGSTKGAMMADPEDFELL